MILTTLGRVLYATVALVNLWLLAGAFERRQWVFVLLSTLIAAIFGTAAVLGRDPMANVRNPPRWLGRPLPPREG